MKSRVAAVVGSLSLGFAGLVVNPAAVHADVACTITDFSPRTAVVGLTAVTKTFSVSTSYCTRVDWNIIADDFYAFDGSSQWTFNPNSNSEAGSQTVVVSAYNGDYNYRERVFADGSSLKRRATWQSFNASPEPARKGSAITIKGRLILAD